MNIITYLINLDGSDERLNVASQQLNNAQIPFIRISAFDGRRLDPKTIKEYDEKKALSYMGRTLKGGELGCYFSHLKCAREFLTTNAKYAIVLEDDMQLTEGANTIPILNQTLAWLEENQIDWYLLHISATKRKIYTIIKSISNKEIIRSHYFPMTTTGLVWSRQGAEAFINQHQTIFAPVDNYFRWWLTRNNKGLSIWPPLVTTTGVQSDIDGSAVKRKIDGRSMMYGLRKQKRLWADKSIALLHKLQI
jgi:glycosyl transferase family 25